MDPFSIQGGLDLDFFNLTIGAGSDQTEVTAGPTLNGDVDADTNQLGGQAGLDLGVLVRVRDMDDEGIPDPRSTLDSIHRAPRPTMVPLSSWTSIPARV